MAKYYGAVGYALPNENAPRGVVSYSDITERMYYGDVLRSTRQWQGGETLNDDLNISVEISILADEFAYQHCHLIRYATYMGTKWKVKDIEPDRPRIVLSLGGVYNEQ